LRILARRESHHVNLSHTLAERYRLIPAVPVDPDDFASSFEAIATRIQTRDRCDRVTALQRAIDENPERYSEYCRAFGDHASLK
jgi:hypothetical protein